MKRGDVDTRSPNLVVRFNEQRFSESEIRALLDIVRPYTEVHASKEYTFSIDLPTILTIVIVLWSSYFAKGFFTKVGEKLGEEVGSDAVQGYRKLKEAVAGLLRRKAGASPCILRFELVSERKLEIHGKVESSSEKELEQAFDTLESLVVMAEDDAREVRETTGEAVVEVHYHYQPNPRSWIMTYGLTSNGRIIRLAEG